MKMVIPKMNQMVGGVNRNSTRSVMGLQGVKGANLGVLIEGNLPIYCPIFGSRM